jgi:hypothetical protein
LSRIAAASPAASIWNNPGYESFFNIALAVRFFSRKNQLSFMVFRKVQTFVHIGKHFFQFIKGFTLGYVFRKIIEPPHEKAVFRFKIGIIQFHIYMITALNGHGKAEAETRPLPARRKPGNFTFQNSRPGWPFYKDGGRGMMAARGDYGEIFGLPGDLHGR